MKSTSRWSEDDVELLKLEYSKTKDILEISNTINRSPKSIVAKLTNLGIYEKKERGNRRGPLSVKYLILILEDYLDIELDMENPAKRENYLNILNALRRRDGIDKSIEQEFLENDNWHYRKNG